MSAWVHYDVVDTVMEPRVGLFVWHDGAAKPKTQVLHLVLAWTAPRHRLMLVEYDTKTINVRPRYWLRVEFVCCSHRPWRWTPWKRFSFNRGVSPDYRTELVA